MAYIWSSRRIAASVSPASIKRVYNPDTSTYAPTKESLAQLRAPNAPEKGVSKRPKVARGVNQSETLKYVLGWVDVGKLISAAKSQTDD